ncbi:hypothetical protein KCTCHS21_32440 [Cohnella abietis]|uniref:Prolipoprotein diacylglyceryl transferase n=1 Tax=Cohnella abietis TaxID=2507935 RepID=A0A3T1D708_9BACL|nr:hypothetical protein KCTCHS21_32440 [Cohnella abietis]
MHSIEIGSLVLNGRLVLFLIYGAVGWLVLKLRFKNLKENDTVMGYASTAFLLWLAVWKGSFILYHPVEFINQPLSLLYFDGGRRGLWTAGLITVLYIAYRSWKRRLSVNIWIGSGIWFVLGCWFAYHMLYLVVGEKPVWFHALSAALALTFILLFIFLRLGFKRELGYSVWFLIGQTVLGFGVTDRQLWLLSFSKPQLLFVIAALLITGWLWLDDTKEKGQTHG